MIGLFVPFTKEVLNSLLHDIPRDTLCHQGFVFCVEFMTNVTLCLDCFRLCR